MKRFDFPAAICILAGVLFIVSGAKAQMADAPAFTVEHRGAMRDIFSRGGIEGTISLSEFRKKPNLYAVAPLEGLRGEITIWDGVPYVSYIRDKSVVVEKMPDAKALFMVWAQVAGWREVPVPETVRSYAELEAFVAEAATAANIDTGKPFPFLLKGAPVKAYWHVNNYVPDGEPLTHEKHDSAKFKGVLENEAVEMVGFYSGRHAGVFTHHTTNMHIHVRSASGRIMGHLDDITLGKGTRLYLPTI